MDYEECAFVFFLPLINGVHVCLSSASTPQSTSRNITGSACACGSTWSRSSSRSSSTSRCCLREGWSHRTERRTTSPKPSSAGEKDAPWHVMSETRVQRFPFLRPGRSCLWRRSIQKLEEMNVGIDHRSDQQWNGLTGNTSVSSPKTTDAHNTPDTGPPKDKNGGVVSSTPFKTGNHGLPSLSESPVPACQRWELITLTTKTSQQILIRYRFYLAIKHIYWPTIYSSNFCKFNLSN